jgi:hypothetical protein
MPLARALFAVMVVCLGAGYLTFTKKLPPRGTSSEIGKFVEAAREDAPFPDDEGFLTLGNGPQRVLYIGDSTLAQYYVRINKILTEHPANTHQAVFAWRAGCAPDAELALINRKECGELLQSAIDYAKDPRVDTVVIGFCWYAYFVGILDSDHVGEAGPLLQGTDRAIEAVRRMVAGFVSQGKRVYIVLQLPVDSGFAPMQMVRRTFLSPGFRIDARPATRAALAQTFNPFLSGLVQISKDTGANIIDPMNHVCDAQSCSPLTATLEPMYHDSWHLRTGYIREHADFIDGTVLDTNFDKQNISAITGQPK